MSSWRVMSESASAGAGERVCEMVARDFELGVLFIWLRERERDVVFGF